MDWAILLYILFIISCIILYIFYCRKLVKIAKDLGIKDNLWLIYIPFVQNYLISKMADFPLWTFIISLFFFMPFVNLIGYFWYYKIVKKYDDSGLWCLAFWIWVFSMDLKEERKLRVKEEKERIEYYQKNKKLIEKKEDNDFRRFLKWGAIILGFLILLAIIKKILG